MTELELLFLTLAGILVCLWEGSCHLDAVTKMIRKKE